jgi:hypothetical protein
MTTSFTEVSIISSPSIIIEFNLFTVLIQTSSHVLFIALLDNFILVWPTTYIYTIRKEGKNPCMCMEMSIGKFWVDVKSIPTWNIGHVWWRITNILESLDCSIRYHKINWDVWGCVGASVGSWIREEKNHIHTLNEKAFENIAERFFNYILQRLLTICHYPILSSNAFRSWWQRIWKWSLSLVFTLFLFSADEERVWAYLVREIKISASEKTRGNKLISCFLMISSDFARLKSVCSPLVIIVKTILNERIKKTN